MTPARGVANVFLGTSEFAAGALRALAAGPHRPRLVVTPPDRPRGRGRRLASPPAAEAARELGIELLQAESVNRPQAVEMIRAAEPTLGTVCAFGQLIGEPLLSELQMLNLHPSLLPRWRGAAPIERAIMAGDATTGVTVMQVIADLDAGPIALQAELEIGPAEDFGSLAERLADRGGELLVRALDLHEAGQLRLTEQDESRATYAEKVTAEDRRLDPSRPAIELERAVRALTPHVGAHLELEGGERLGVRAARAAPGEAPAGSLGTADGALRLGCAEGLLRICAVQPPGGREMTADAYLRGHEPPARVERVR